MYFNMIDHPVRMLGERPLSREFYIAGLKKIIYAKMGLPNSGVKRAARKGQVMGCAFLDNQHANKELASLIGGDKPFFLSRYGATEFSLCVTRELIQHGVTDGYNISDLDKGKKNSGIFPKDPKTMAIFTDEYISALKKADMNAYWGQLVLEEYIGKKLFSSTCKQHTMRALEPFQYDDPWTGALEGKKVLVVHPFADLIQYQYTIREQLFSNKKILPLYELYTIQAVQSSGETIPTQYNSWMDALDSMAEKCLAIDFDIALLGCGSYAVPLGARLKDCGKKAIVLGGMLQLLYGIKGERWERSRPDIVALYNEAWIRAGEQYKIKGTEKMADGAAYW